MAVVEMTEEDTGEQNGVGKSDVTKPLVNLALTI